MEKKEFKALVEYFLAEYTKVISEADINQVISEMALKLQKREHGKTYKDLAAEGKATKKVKEKNDIFQKIMEM